VTEQDLRKVARAIVKTSITFIVIAFALGVVVGVLAS
jgi:hypothetical protein